MKKRYLLVFITHLFFNVLFGQDIHVYLVGDAGEPDFPVDDNLAYLKSVLEEAGTEDVLIFLGDNLYPVGLPDESDPARSAMEDRLNESLKLMKAFKGRSIIIPGNHDWAGGSKAGWDQLLHMQTYVDEYMGKATVFLPRNGCPGPVEVEISDDIRVIVLDTQYLLHPWSKPDATNSCESGSTLDVLNQVRDIIIAHEDEHLILAAHHPMYSYGQHGGHFTLRQHLFPLTDANKNLWIPLPILGSIYPIYRKVFGLRQDITNPGYRAVRDELVEVLEMAENLVYVNGHEHSIQYILKNGVHYVTSGSGSKSSPVDSGKGTRFAKATNGFARLSYQNDGKVALSFYEGQKREMIFNETIYQRESIGDPDLERNVDFSDSMVIAPISTQYTGFGEGHRFWLGNNYREVWATPVEMPLFDLAKEHGGLEIVKLGGGNQTKSLRLEARDGSQYTLRSLEKYTEKLLPDILRKTFAQDILQDQISGSNPYGAFAIPPLAEAAGIYHTNPQLVMIPDDPRFGKFREIFAGLPVLYEERPNDEVSHESYFGKGEDIKGTPDLIEELHDDNDEQVDQAFALRSRLFDMVIGDWDRHEDQWRWVRTDKQPDGHLWRPIPRDRDQAFYINEGIVGWLVSRKFILPNTEGFDERMDYPPGFNTSARFFDRTYLTALDWKDWEEEITYLEENLTDRVIEDALHVLPDTIQSQVANRIVRVLKARRDDMRRFARIHYLFVSREVEITGSNKHEYFKVERLNPEETKVTVRKRKKDGELAQILYERIFKTDETNEIRLYGLEGEDVFELVGAVKNGILVRIIGGEGEDVITDESNVSGFAKKTKVYDLRSDTKLTRSGETRSKLSNKNTVNRYNRTAFEYDKLIPLISAQFNRDDGLFIGGGFIYTKEGWRKDPFAARHQLNANIAFATGAFNLNYKGIWSDVMGSWDLGADISLQQPYAVANFFGFGNNSQFDFKGEDAASAFEDEINYYRIRYRKTSTFLHLNKGLGVSGAFRAGGEYLAFRLDEDANQDRFINEPFSGVDPEQFYDGLQFIGAKADLNMDTRDNKLIPTKGLTSEISLARYFGINSGASDFSKFSASFGFLFPLWFPDKIVLANRVGVDYLFGSLQFFNGATLGKSELRGYRRTRFIGNTSFYHNIDLRIHLFDFKTYFLPVGVGLIAFHDLGRVWLDGEDADQWQTSKGLGIWLAPLNRVVFTFSYAISEEEKLPIVTFGYHF